MAIYNITQNAHIDMNGIAGMNNETSQQWKVTTAEGGNVVIDMLVQPQPQQQTDAEIYQLLNLINKTVSRIEFSFDMNDRLILYNSDEIVNRFKNCRDEVVSVFGIDQSIMQMLDVVGNTANDFGRELRNSLLYYTMWSWFGGGKSFHITPKSILHADHDVGVQIIRAKKDILPDDTIHLMESGEGQLSNLSGFKNEYSKQVQPLTNGASFDYRYSVKTDFFCSEDNLPLFNHAVTSITEQASEDYIYSNKIEFTRIEEKV